MAFVYILKNEGRKHYYIGSTIDIQRRYAEHLSGRHPSSKRLRNPELIFKQEFDNMVIARKVEKRLKSYKRRDFIEKIVRDGFIRTH